MLVDIDCMPKGKGKRLLVDIDMKFMNEHCRPPRQTIVMF